MTIDKNYLCLMLVAGLLSLSAEGMEKVESGAVAAQSPKLIKKVVTYVPKDPRYIVQNPEPLTVLAVGSLSDDQLKAVFCRDEYRPVVHESLAYKMREAYRLHGWEYGARHYNNAHDYKNAQRKIVELIIHYVHHVDTYKDYSDEQKKEIKNRFYGEIKATEAWQLADFFENFACRSADCLQIDQFAEIGNWHLASLFTEEAGEEVEEDIDLSDLRSCQLPVDKDLKDKRDEIVKVYQKNLEEDNFDETRGLIKELSPEDLDRLVTSYGLLIDEENIHRLSSLALAIDWVMGRAKNKKMAEVGMQIIDKLFDSQEGTRLDVVSWTNGHESETLLFQCIRQLQAVPGLLMSKQERLHYQKIEKLFSMLLKKTKKVHIKQELEALVNYTNLSSVTFLSPQGRTVLDVVIEHIRLRPFYNSPNVISIAKALIEASAYDRESMRDLYVALMNEKKPDSRYRDEKNIPQIEALIEALENNCIEQDVDHFVARLFD